MRWRAAAHPQINGHQDFSRKVVKNRTFRDDADTMTRPARRILTAAVALAATLSFVGVSAALEGEDPTLGEEEVTCPDEGTTDAGATDDGATDEGVPEADECEAPEGDDDATDEDATDEDATDEDATDEDATDGTTDEPVVEDDATDGTEDEVLDESVVDEPKNHGAAVSQAAHECPKGPEHGACVREVAQSDVGKKTDGADDEVAPEGGPGQGKGQAKGKGKDRS